jgi:hypothetical protein
MCISGVSPQRASSDGECFVDQVVFISVSMKKLGRNHIRLGLDSKDSSIYGQ